MLSLLAMGCNQSNAPTAVTFLNHSGHELEGEIVLRDEGTRFSPMSCTIFPLEFREGDLIEAKLTDVFTAEIFRSKTQLSTSRASQSSQSLYISVQPDGHVAAAWHDLSRTDHAIHAEGMYRFHKVIPVTVQLTGTRGAGIVRVYQANFQYVMTSTSNGTSSYGYLRTDSKDSTHILVTYKDEQGSITKFASIPDALLQEWIHKGIDGLSIGIDVQTDQATIYSVAGSDRDAYLLSQKAVSGGIKQLAEPVVLRMSQSRLDVRRLFDDQLAAP